MGLYDGTFTVTPHPKGVPVPPPRTTNTKGPAPPPTNKKPTASAAEFDPKNLKLNF